MEVLEEINCKLNCYMSLLIGGIVFFFFFNGFIDVGLEFCLWIIVGVKEVLEILLLLIKKFF